MSQMPKLLAHRVALVTGSTQGLGEGIAMRMARAGARVIVHGRDVAKGERVRERLRALGGAAEFIAADLRYEAQARNLVSQAVAMFGAVDFLINNAQIVPLPTRSEHVDVAQHCMPVLESGLFASLWTSQAVHPYMRSARFGRIVNFASINGAFGSKYGLAYNATKEAIRGLTRTLANEWGIDGITVNAVLPSGWSPAYEAFYHGDEKKAEAVARLNPMRRHGRAEEDIGAAVVGLVGPGSQYITGQSLYLDGGAHLLGLPQLHSLGDG
jgi:NAD(P)-dependent dehydrogenase (short-subunit alcohol dehydrogenase family)